MKTKIICIAVLLAGAAAGFSACDSLEKEKFPVENYSVNVDNYVTPGFVDIDAGASATLSLRVNSPFETTILKGPAYSVDALGSGVFGVTLGSVPDVKYDKNAAYAKYGNIPGYSEGKSYYNITRDVELFVRPVEMNLTVEGFDMFCYPVRVRQRGSDGTYYLTGEQVWNLNEDNMFGGVDQHYVKATVKSAGTVYSDSGRYTPDAAVGDLWQVPATGQYLDKAPDLEAMDVILDVDGVNLKVKVHYFAAYKLVGKLNIHAGDTVEMNVPNSGIFRGDDTLWVSPLDIIVI